MFVASFALALGSVSFAAPQLFGQVAHATPGTTVNISNITDLRNAVENQDDGQTWTINAGDYGLDRFNDITAGGETGWYLPITKNGITIKGDGNPTLYGNEYSANGSRSSQDLIAVFGNDVKISGLTLMPKVEPNKTIEVLGNNFTLENTTITPNTKVDASVYGNIASSADKAFAEQWGGSIYFSHEGNHDLSNVTIHNGGISFRYSPSGTHIAFSNVNITDNTSDNQTNAYRFSSGFNNSGNTIVGAPKVTYNVDSTLNNLDSVLAGAQNGDVLNINSDLTASHQINITKALTINGNGHTVTATSTIPSNSAVIAPSVANGLTISDLTVDGAGVAMLHGINAFKSTMDLNDVTVMNNTKSGLVVNSSQVTVNNITTLNNAWNGIDVDQNNASSAWPSKLTVNGTSTHTEVGPDIFIDNITKPVSVVGTNSQYNVTSNGNARVYKLKPVPPTLTATTPSEGQSVATVTNGNKLKIIGSFTDDVKANYATMQLVYNGNSVAIGTLYGYGSTYNPAATYATADGSYVFNLPVPANLASGEYSLFYTGTDFDGGITSRMERMFNIDNTKPHVVGSVEPALNPSSFTITATDNTAIKFVTGNVYSSANVLVKGNSSSTQNPFTVDLSTLADGNYYVKYNASDMAGNVSNTEQYFFTVDKTAPTGLANSYPLNGVYVTTAGLSSIDWTDASDSSAPVSYYYQSSHSSATNPDGSFVSPVYTSGALSSSTIPTAGTLEGVYYWHVRAVDFAGNSSTWTAPWRITVDNTAPTSTNDLATLVHGTITIHQNISDNFASKSGKLRIWQVGGNGFYASPEVTVDSSNNITYSLNTSTDLFGDGQYIAKFTSWDQAGNPSISQVNFTVDNTGPVVTIADITAPITTGSVIPTVTATDVSAPLKYLWTANPTNLAVISFTDNIAQPIFTPTVAGTYNFTLLTTDALGNQTTKTFGFIYTPPVVTPNGTTPSAIVVTPQPTNNNLGAPAVLGAQTTDTTQTPAADALGTPAVKGASDQLATTTPSSSSTGLAWYWWVLIVAAVVSFIWWLIARLRSRANVA